MLHRKIIDIEKVIEELQQLKAIEKIAWTTKIYGQWIFISLTSDLSEALANYYAKNQHKSFRGTTVDELITILELDIEEKKLALEEQDNTLKTVWI